MTIAEDGYMKQMTQRGHEELGKTALVLAILWEKADIQSRKDLGRNLTNEFYRVLTQVWGWKPYEAKAATAELTRAFKEILS